LKIFVDLGANVLDGAMVETALIIIDHKNNIDNRSIFINKYDSNQKDLSFKLLNSQNFSNNYIQKDLNYFLMIPKYPISYWINDSLINAFNDFKSFEEIGNEAWVGLQTNDDFQWVRCFWEVGYQNFEDNHFNDTGTGTWVPYSKGGGYAKYHPDIHLVINWYKNGRDIKIWKKEQFRLGLITENNSKCWNKNKYFNPGLTWSQRSQIGLSVRALPKGCIFGIKGPGAFSKKKDLILYLGLFNSSIFKFFVSLQMAFGSYDTGVIRRTPVPSFSLEDKEQHDIERKIITLWELNRDVDSLSETTRSFINCALLVARQETIKESYEYWMTIIKKNEKKMAENEVQLDFFFAKSYNVQNFIEQFKNLQKKSNRNNIKLTNFVFAFIQQLVGFCFGRWDIHFSIY